MLFAVPQFSAMFFLAIDPKQAVIWGIVALMALLWIVFLFIAVRYFNWWLRAMMAGANIPLIALIGMKLRRSPVDQIVRLRIMAVQAGLAVSTRQIESALLQGADAERAVLAMMRARDLGKEMTWDEVLAADTNERLQEKLNE